MEGKGSTKELVCKYAEPMDTDNRVVKASGGRWEHKGELEGLNWRKRGTYFQQ